MQPIPKKLREEIAQDPTYKRCALSGYSGCSGRIEWHHHIIFAGKQLNEKWAIIGLCKGHHRDVAPITSSATRGGVLGLVDRKVLNRATREELKAISKSIDYTALRDKLNS